MGIDGLNPFAASRTPYNTSYPQRVDACAMASLPIGLLMEDPNGVPICDPQNFPSLPSVEFQNFLPVFASNGNST